MNRFDDAEQMIADALESLRDGELNPQELEEIRQLLLSSREARVHYLKHNQLERMLETNHSQETTDKRGFHSVSSVVVDASESTDFCPWIVYPGAAVAALALIFVALNGGWFLGIGLTANLGMVEGDAKQQAVDESLIAPASIIHQVDARWRDDVVLRTGQELDVQWLHLESGVVQLEFASGAQLALQGDTDLHVRSDMECFLQKGRLTVLAPPQASQFTVKSPSGNVIDIGTEFGVEVDERGRLDVHVLDGEVELEIVTDEFGKVERKRLFEDEAASIQPGGKEIEDIVMRADAFESFRHEVLMASHPLKLQFDCGVRAGVYRGTQSPGHAAGEFLQHEVYWNPVMGDQSGSVALADGTILNTALEIDYGRGIDKKVIDWHESPDLRGNLCRSRGVFATELGRDNINSKGHLVGLRIRGLPVGRYRVYLMGRATLDKASWGNFLVTKAFRTAVGLNLNELPERTVPLSPLDDPDASKWVEGQTHSVTVVDVTNSNDYLTIISSKDRLHSPNPKGGRSVIVGFQIVELK